eukprot:TRINITY_DN8330_c0_g1_i1.p1 TRINITY_DN8330_c0_g1~~TRINITY_DN8330_c0_g1_i1.p1  ORF type:complete len:261 (-),score=47.79 TRINITY_DN8330_c0_g1_i1:5-787(-)
MSSYTPLEKIGEGTDSTIYKVIDSESNCYALKCFKTKPNHNNPTENVLREIEIMRKLANHPQICEFVQDYQFNGISMVLSLYDCDLFVMMEREGTLSLKRVKVVAVHMIKALDACHQQNVIHRDVKSENVLYDAEQQLFVLCDFGHAAVLEGESDCCVGISGTRQYIAPEMILEEKYQFEVDWWQLGVLLYEVSVGWLPFESDDLDELFNMILNESIIFPKGINRELKRLIKGLTVKDPRGRYTDPMYMLNHEFIRSDEN